MRSNNSRRDCTPYTKLRNINLRGDFKEKGCQSTAQTSLIERVNGVSFD